MTANLYMTSKMLPLAAVVAGPPRPAATEVAADAASRSVLVIDDNADGREMLRSVRAAGHRVLESGVACAITGRPDIAFVDIGLPTIDGYEVARRVRASLGGGAPRLVALSRTCGARSPPRARRDSEQQLHRGARPLQRQAHPRALEGQRAPAGADQDVR